MEDLIYWIALNQVFSEDSKPPYKLIHRFASLKEIFSLRKQDLLSLGMAEWAADRLLQKNRIDLAKKEIDWLKKKGYTPVSLKDQRYPDLLREIFNPPLVLYCAGKIEVLKAPSIALVGARQPTPYGRVVAEKLAYDLASSGLIIVSGLARGIDSIAHRGAVKGGRTTAVLGSGLNNIYPREHGRLFEKIIETGIVMTEFPKDAAPLGRHFPMRNRIISGISLATVVVEATGRSGSLITARLALDQNREVMAVPGNITSPLSAGCNWLLQNGAKPITSWADIVQGLPSPHKERFCQKPKEEKPLTLSNKEKTIYDLLKADSLIHIDEIISSCSYSVSETLSILLNLELEGLAHQAPGKYYQRNL